MAVELESTTHGGDAFILWRRETLLDGEPIVGREDSLDHELVQLSGGDEMSAISADAFLRSQRSRVVALVGGNDVGKTTLLASLYELAGLDRLTDFAFAGCETLRGFEARCHLSRAASNRLVPETKRTPLAAGPRFLHLCFLKESKHLNLLFADRAGEAYVEMLNSPTIISMPELLRADSIALLVDGNDLCDPTRRHLQITRTRRFWMMLQQNEIVSRTGLSIQVVLTKLDILKKAKEGAAGLTAFKDLFDEIRKDYGNGESPPTIHCVSARPSRPSELEFGTGLEELLHAWSPPETLVTHSHLPIVVQARNPYERLIERIVTGSSL